MEKNPFNELISQIKEISKSHTTENQLFNVGVVVSGLPDLVIRTSGIEIDKDNIMIDEWIVRRHNEAETYTSTSAESHTHKVKDYVDILQVGDKVIMLRENDMFYIISKVVNI